MKRTRIVVLALVMGLVLSTTALAGVPVHIDGVHASFEVEPVVVDGRIMVSAQELFALFDAEYEFDEQLGVLTVARDEHEFVMTVDQGLMLVGDDEQDIDVPAQVIDDVLMVPLRASAEALDGLVIWDQDERAAFIGITWPDAIELQAGYMYMYVFSVGLGDSILIISDDAQKMLIDGGKQSQGPYIVQYLQRLGVKNLSYVVATHPHTDHIGGLISVLQPGYFSVSTVYDSGLAMGTQVYQNYVNAVQNHPSHPGWYYLRRGHRFGMGNVSFTTIWPVTVDNVKDPNEASIVFHLKYGNLTMLLTGDLPGSVEMNAAVRSDILKVAHHGSQYSTSTQFLQAVNPTVSIISCPGTVHHPHESTITRLQQQKSWIYRTDYNSHVEFVTDGTNHHFSAPPWWIPTMTDDGCEQCGEGTEDCIITYEE